VTSLASASVMRATSLPASRLWTGRVITGLMVAFLTFDAVGKLLRITPVVEASQQLELSADYSVGIGLLLLICTVLHVIPRTANIGAILLTGYLGGAAAIQLRADNGAFPIGFAVGVGVLVWTGLAMREPRVIRWALKEDHT